MTCSMCLNPSFSRRIFPVFNHAYHTINDLAKCWRALTCEYIEEGDHDDGVAEVEQGGDDPGDLQLHHKVVDAVDEEVDGGEAGREEGTPPPVVVLYRGHT